MISRNCIHTVILPSVHKSFADLAHLDGERGVELRSLGPRDEMDEFGDSTGSKDSQRFFSLQQRQGMD